MLSNSCVFKSVNYITKFLNALFFCLSVTLCFLNIKQCVSIHKTYAHKHMWIKERKKKQRTIRQSQRKNEKLISADPATIWWNYQIAPRIEQSSYNDQRKLFLYYNHIQRINCMELRITTKLWINGRNNCKRAVNGDKWLALMDDVTMPLVIGTTTVIQPYRNSFY